MGQNINDSSRVSSPWAVMISVPNFGLIVPHSKQMSHLIQGHSFGFHAYLNNQFSGKKYWHEIYNMPEHGIDLTYIFTGNPDQLGHQLSLQYLLNLPLHRRASVIRNPARKVHFKHWIGVGLGLGYASKIWDLRENHQAIAIGSHHNAAVTLQYSGLIKQFNTAQLRGGLRITHFSNGAFQMPNLGTNNIGVFLTYAFGKPKESNPINLLSAHEIGKKYHTSFSVSGGVKEIAPPSGKKYAAFAFTVLEEKRISFKSSLGAGIDVFYNTSLKTLSERRKNEIISNAAVLQSGIVFSYTLHFDDFELKMHQGVYVLDRYKLDGLFYNLFGLRYHINENWFAQFALKTHFARADFGELGWGYSF